MDEDKVYIHDLKDYGCVIMVMSYYGTDERLVNFQNIKCENGDTTEFKYTELI